jgi:hypothetical protein
MPAANLTGAGGAALLYHQLVGAPAASKEVGGTCFLCCCPGMAWPLMASTAYYAVCYFDRLNLLSLEGQAVTLSAIGFE